jgi:hypothetical protein
LESVASLPRPLPPARVSEAKPQCCDLGKQSLVLVVSPNSWRSHRFSSRIRGGRGRISSPTTGSGVRGLAGNPSFGGGKTRAQSGKEEARGRRRHAGSSARRRCDTTPSTTRPWASTLPLGTGRRRRAGCRFEQAGGFPQSSHYTNASCRRVVHEAQPRQLKTRCSRN